MKLLTGWWKINPFYLVTSKLLYLFIRILRTGIICDVPQDFSVDMLDSISSLLKILDIHRLNRRTKIDNELK